VGAEVSPHPDVAVLDSIEQSVPAVEELLAARKR
jgi:hypothetical protein